MRTVKHELSMSEYFIVLMQFSEGITLRNIYHSTKNIYEPYFTCELQKSSLYVSLALSNTAVIAFWFKYFYLFISCCILQPKKTQTLLTICDEFQQRKTQQETKIKTFPMVTQKAFVQIFKQKNKLMSKLHFTGLLWFYY